MCLGGLALLTVSACSAGPADEAVMPPTSSSARVEQSASPAPLPTSEASAASCPPAPLEVAITYELAPTASGGTIVEAETNLPEGSELGASFFVENGFFAQDDDVVRGGHASFGPFTDDGSPLRGSYELSITLPIARNQPATVQACIGTAGELLSGPLVSTEEITGDRVASLNALVTIT